MRGRSRRSSGNNSRVSRKKIPAHFRLIDGSESTTNLHEWHESEWFFLICIIRENSWLDYLANGKIGSISTGTLFSLTSACCIGGLITAYLSRIALALS